MSRRCRLGIRARFIKGPNQGKVVLVVRYYCGEKVNGAYWPKALFPWVVGSLGAPLRSFCANTGEEAHPSMTVVADDSDLEPLQNDDMDEDDYVERPADAKDPKGIGRPWGERNHA